MLGAHEFVLGVTFNLEKTIVSKETNVVKLKKQKEKTTMIEAK